MFGEEAAPAVASLLDRSYDSYEKFNSPLGIGHLWEHLHHFDPDPWNNTHGIGLTGDGIGIDRTEASGSGYIGLYHREQAKVFADPRTCPLRFLLYFHHLPWRHRLPCGRTLIQYLYDSTWDGAAEVAQFRREWRGLHGKIDLDRWAHVYEKTGMAAVHAERWRDLLCRFFLEASGIPDARGRFSESSPSPHARVRSGFPQALEDYMERVKRMRRRIKATTAGATQ
jgi:alpha-glucuronidase